MATKIKKHPRSRYPLLIGIFFIVLIGVFFAFNWQNLWVVAQQKYFLLINRDRATTSSWIETKTFDAKSLQGKQKLYKVYLPGAYKDNPDQHFPVLYLLHGYPGTPDDWLINANLQHQLDQLFQDEKNPPYIVVLPDGNGPIVQDSQYVNAPAVKQNMEDYVLEIVNQVDQSYRTKPQREFRALGGVSSGGYAAVNVGFHHNETFSYMLSISGYFVNKEYIMKKLFQGYAEEEKKNNPLSYINEVKVSDPSFIYLEVGSKDYASFLKDNHALDDKLSEENIPHLLHISEGSHGWGSWIKSFSPPFENLADYWKTQIEADEKLHASPTPSPQTFFHFPRKKK